MKEELKRFSFMFVKIVRLDKIIFKGEVKEVVVPGKHSQLTILSHHIPLICPLGKGKVKIKKNKEKVFEIEEGILKVDKKEVNILLTHYGPSREN
jgi:F-type H+-transporting ATPase subunit epsilon